MKPTFISVIILGLSIVLGVAVSVYLSNHNFSDQLIAPIDNALPNESVNYPPVKSVVISVPAEGEYYIRMRRFDLTEISGRCRLARFYL